MRFANFRDFVLWPIAYKIGLDPTTNFEDSQARAIGDYINMYVRKAWASADFPEWSVISNFVPGAGKPVQDHIVELNNDGTIGNVNVSKVLAVYLNDPRKYDLPLEIPFIQLSQGVYVGLDHGNQVWIKYLTQPPIYTATSWNTNITYGKGDITYSPVAGECYVSLINGNKGNDPVALSGGIPPSPTLVQPFVPGSPGFDAQPKISYIQMATSAGVTIPDPPPASSLFKWVAKDSTGAVIATATHTANGTESLAAIMSILAVAIATDPDLSTFTITQNATDLLTNFSNASEFGLSGGYQPTGGNHTLALVVAQTQSYVPSTPPTDPTPQSTQIRLTNQDVKPGATFKFTFIDTLGTVHVAYYTALAGDGIATVLSGVATAIQAQASTDPIFAQLVTLVDGSNGIITVSSPQPGAIGFDWFYTPPPEPEPPPPGQKGTWWALQPFPYDLVDVVIRGANVEVLKEWGQLQGGMAEEQALPAELGNRTTIGRNQEVRDAMPRGGGRSRYAMK